MKNDEEIREKVRLAVISSFKAISYDVNKKQVDIDNTLKNFNLIDNERFKFENDFSKLRARSDSEALKFKYSDFSILEKNKPKNNVQNNLYNISEKIRYELIGSKKYNGIRKNLKKFYLDEKINIIAKNLSKEKEISTEQAFEIYMLKKFLDFNLEHDISKKFTNLEK